MDLKESDMNDTECHQDIWEDESDSSSQRCPICERTTTLLLEHSRRTLRSLSSTIPCEITWSFLCFSRSLELFDNISSQASPNMEPSLLVISDIRRCLLIDNDLASNHINSYLTKTSNDNQCPIRVDYSKTIEAKQILRRCGNISTYK
jgi:hypothetical protein